MTAHLLSQLVSHVKSHYLNPFCLSSVRFQEAWITTFTAHAAFLCLYSYTLSHSLDSPKTNSQWMGRFIYRNSTVLRPLCFLPSLLVDIFQWCGKPVAMLGRSSVLKLQWLSHSPVHTYGCKLTSLKSSMSSAVEMAAFYTKNQLASAATCLGRCNDPFAPDEHKCVSEQLVCWRRVTNGGPHMQFGTAVV